MSEEANRESLKEKILEEMTVNYSKLLEQNFDLAKQFIRLTKDGDVEILVKEKVSGPEKILLYLIGKLYAKEAGLTSTDEIGNNELMEKLGVPSGSLLPWLKGLRDKKKIKRTRREHRTYHSVPISLVEKTLEEITEKLRKPDSVKEDV